MVPAWKKLLQQAFASTAIPTDRHGRCGILHTYQYIYLALRQAGIENRSPFSLAQVIAIRLLSRRDPDSVRLMCMQNLRTMKQPSLGYSYTGRILALMILAFGTTMIISPRTANTFRVPTGEQTVLQYRIQPLEELDAIEINLPTTSDYQFGSGTWSPLTHLVPQRSDSSLADAAWILSQPANAYSLQLLSAATPASLQQFCRRHRICHNSAYYRSEVNGKTLYRLLYGSYASSAAADSAKASLPVEVQQMTPWIRQFRRVRDEITRG
jgi:hypothetical protein